MCSGGIIGSCAVPHRNWDKVRRARHVPIGQKAEPWKRDNHVPIGKYFSILPKTDSRYTYFP